MKAQRCLAIRSEPPLGAVAAFLPHVQSVSTFGWIERSGLTQQQIAGRFGVTQPRISDLSRGKIDLFSIDTLVNMLTAAGLRLDVRIVPAAG